MVSHYLFEAEFCNPAAGWEKGQVEKNVQDARHRLWQPVPQTERLDALNLWLEARCKPRLLGITKRGSRYLRKNLIQGARSSLPIMSRIETRLGPWLRGLLSRAHPNTVVVALAAKMARIVWALLRHERTRKQPE